MEAIKRWLGLLGPGLITGASDDDPSGISTYAVTGATTGFGLLWLLALTTPMMAVIQGMCARLGMVTGVGLGTTMRERLSPWLLYPLALLTVGANIINAGADLEGMAASATMVLGIPPWAWILFFGVLLTLFQMFLSYGKIAAVIKWLTVALFAYVVTAFIVHPPWGQIAHSLVVPHVEFKASFLTTAMALMGTTITPYLFFWQASLEVEEEKKMGRTTRKARRGATAQEISDEHADVNTGMILSNVVAFFIIVTTAATLFATGHTHISSAQDAAEALRPLAGRFAYLLFALGMVGTGLLAIPALVGSSAYVVAECYKWNEGLGETIRSAPGFYGTLVVGTLIAMAMGFLRIDPIAALYWSAVINGVVAVPLLAMIVWFASDEKLMGKWRSSRLARAWGWATVACMGVSAISIFVFWGKS